MVVHIIFQCCCCCSYLMTSGQNRGNPGCLCGLNQVPLYSSGRNGPRIPSSRPIPATTPRGPHLRQVHPILAAHPPRSTRLLYAPSRTMAGLSDHNNQPPHLRVHTSATDDDGQQPSCLMSMIRLIDPLSTVVPTAHKPPLSPSSKTNVSTAISLFFSQPKATKVRQ